MIYTLAVKSSLKSCEDYLQSTKNGHMGLGGALWIMGFRNLGKPAAPAFTTEPEKFVNSSRKQRRHSCGSRAKATGVPSQVMASKSASTTGVSSVGAREATMLARVDTSTPCRYASHSVLFVISSPSGARCAVSACGGRCCEVGVVGASMDVDEAELVEKIQTNSCTKTV